MKSPEIKKNKCQHLANRIRTHWRMNLIFFFIGLISSNFIYLVSIRITEDQNFNNKISVDSSEHRLAIIVPFRDRFDELMLFVPHISKFLANQSIKNFHIFIINQVDDFRFNRASLINVGFLEAMANNFTYIIMHDVDLLPMNVKLNYSYPLRGVHHISAPGLHPKYNYNTFIGGILAVNKKDFIAVNGMSNRYWGWGREDDDFYLRLTKRGIPINRADITEFKTGKKFTFVENHNPKTRQRDVKRFKKQNEESLRLEASGLNNVQYRVGQRRLISVDGYECTSLDVEFFCDRSDTHWCTNDYQFED